MVKHWPPLVAGAKLWEWPADREGANVICEGNTQSTLSPLNATSHVVSRTTVVAIRVSVKHTTTRDGGRQESACV